MLTVDLAITGEKIMTVLNFHSDRYRATPVDDDAPLPAGWESSRREQLRRFRALPLAEKIKAVEELERLARALAEAVARGKR